MEGPYVGDHLNIGFLNIRDCVLHYGDDRLDVVIYLGAALAYDVSGVLGYEPHLGVKARVGPGGELGRNLQSPCVGTHPGCPQMKTSMGKSSGTWISSCYGRSICWRPA